MTPQTTLRGRRAPLRLVAALAAAFLLPLVAPSAAVAAEGTHPESPVIVTPSDGSRHGQRIVIEATWPQVSYGYATKVAVIARQIAADGKPGQPWTIVHTDQPTGITTSWIPP